MRYLYSVLRFVPDPARGEFVNVGAIIGSDESGEWVLRHVERMTRARKLDSRGVLAEVFRRLDDMGTVIDEYTESVEAGVGGGPDVGEEWLLRLWEDSSNLIQLSEPAPISAASLESALNIVFDEMIVEPERRRFPFKKKIAAVAALRRAYMRNGLHRHQEFTERAVVHGQHHMESFDFVVANGRVAQLAQAWSFQVPDQLYLVEAIKAWAWSVSDIRRSGGKVVMPLGREVDCPANVDVCIAYVPPIEGADNHVLDEALSAFREVGAKAQSFEDVDSFGAQARRALGA